MSRRASVFARLNPGKRRVRFPDEVVFEDHIKESDGDAIMNMLRRASVDIDLDRINMAGMTALHQAVLDDNLVMVRLLIQHGARMNKKDEDGWTPLHAAAANGLHLIAKYLISQGADKEALTDEEEKAVDLADPDDYKTISVLLNTQESLEKERRLSTVGAIKKEPAWFRRESMQRDSVLDPALYRVKLGADERKLGVRLSSKQSDKDTFASLRARKGSLWVGSQSKEVVKEEDEEEKVEVKKVVKVEKVVEKMDTVASVSSVGPSSSVKDSEMETEESVSSKLEQWKRRRIERLER